MSLLATVALFCALTSRTTLTATVAVTTADPLGAYELTLPLPAGVSLLAVTLEDPFTAVWFVDATNTLRVAGWQVASLDEPVGTVPVVSLTFGLHGRTRALVPQSAEVFTTDAVSESVLLSGCAT